METLRTVADVTDDEIVDAIARRFGLRGVRDEDRCDMIDLGFELGLEGDTDDVIGLLTSRLDSIRCDARRLVCHGQTLTPAEWGRRIEAALADGARDIAGTVARLLEGERGEPNTGWPLRGEDAGQLEGFPDPGAGFCRGLAAKPAVRFCEHCVGVNGHKFSCPVGGARQVTLPAEKTDTGPFSVAASYLRKDEG
jgi:hypothetical protein